MGPPARGQIEQMAFMAMMDGIIHTTVSCNCAACKSEIKSRGGSRPQPPKRNGSDNPASVKNSTKVEGSGSCGHSNATLESKPPTPTPSGKKATAASQNKAGSSSANNPARSDKVNSLLKADSVQAVFDVFNMTNTSKDEKDLANRIQNATKDCKLYQETRDKILEICDDEELDLDAVFGLLTKFRYERNMLTTAVIKGNSEREKALLCIQRVDHLMFMLQEVARKKDSEGGDVMGKLGDIIMEIHEIAKTPSTLYDELLDIKDEHLDLLNDHDEMHQKFVDVNSCHEKLHSSHDKLQTEHTKLLKDYSEMKKKASILGSLKNDISRLEKAVDRSNDENSSLKKEVERLNAELAKVNALKHENVQLKKKLTILSAAPQSLPPEEIASSIQGPGTKKKKGKKGSEAVAPPNITPAPAVDNNTKLIEAEKAHKVQVAKLTQAHDTVNQELEQARANLKQLNSLIRKAERERDRAIERLEDEKAFAQNWKGIAEGHLTERDRLQADIERHLAQATQLKSTVTELEQTLDSTRNELAEQTAANREAREEIQRRSPMAHASEGSQQQLAMPSQDTVRLLRKIKAETHQLARDVDEPKYYDGRDQHSYLSMIQQSVRHVASEVERDIEDILSVREGDFPSNPNPHIHEAVMSFTYNHPQPRQTSRFSPHPDYSPQSSPQVPPSSTLLPYRPMMPPPGFTEPAANPFNANQAYVNSRPIDSPSAPFSRISEPPGLSTNFGFNRGVEQPAASTSRYGPIMTPSSSLTSHSPLHSNNSNTLSATNFGVIGSKSVSKNKPSKTPSPAPTPAQSTDNGSLTSATTTATSGLGNGAVGVDWNMWARPGR